MTPSPTLYLLRHAEAVPAGAQGDHARALAPEGRRAARAVGRFLARRGEAPARLLASSAARARETAELAREAGGWDAPSELSDALYAATPDSLFALLRGLTGEPARVLVVAHQPTLGLAVRALTGGEPDLPPATLARVDLDAARWGELGPGRGRLAWVLAPAGLDVSKRAR